MRYTFIIILCPLFAFAQPYWVSKTPQGYINDYYVGKGTSNISAAEASKIALEDAIISIIRNNNMVVDYSASNVIESKQKNIDENVPELEIVRRIREELSIQGYSTTVNGLKEVENYFEDSGENYSAWVLVTVPKKNPLPVPSSFEPIWRSSLFPGWGQLYKKETFKGISFLVLSLGSVASGFIFKQLSNDSSVKAYSARTQQVRDFYNNESKNYDTYSKVGFISAAVFYVWSLVDAIIVKQDDFYVFIDENNFGTDLCLRISL